jgi:hypothetical protein
VKNSFHSLIPFLLSLLYHLLLPSPELYPILFLCSQAHITAGWQLEIRLTSMLLLPVSEFFFITTLHGPRRKHSLSIVGKACLECRCIATEVTRLLLAY